MEPVFQTNVISVGQRTYMIGSQFLTQRYKNRTLFVFLCDEINTIFFLLEVVLFCEVILTTTKIVKRKFTICMIYANNESVNNQKTVKTVMTLTWYMHF